MEDELVKILQEPKYAYLNSRNIFFELDDVNLSIKMRLLKKLRSWLLKEEQAHEGLRAIVGRLYKQTSMKFHGRKDVRKMDYLRADCVRGKGEPEYFFYETPTVSLLNTKASIIELVKRVFINKLTNKKYVFCKKCTYIYVVLFLLTGKMSDIS